VTSEAEHTTTTARPPVVTWARSEAKMVATSSSEPRAVGACCTGSTTSAGSPEASGLSDHQGSSRACAASAICDNGR
jgi:hypothetical protein